MELRPGTRIGTRYELIARLGRGSIGSVWAARDEVLAREVAIKFLNDEHLDTEAARGRFVREAHTTARLSLPGIVPVHDLGTLPGGRAYFVMQRIVGTTFADLITREEPPLDELLHVFAQVCQIIAYAHDRGIIHRDLKPENILIGELGGVYVADWGMARALTAATEDQPRKVPATLPGQPHGALHYMPPEQARGDLARLGPESDVFGLGAILFEVLTGMQPFPGETWFAVLHAIISTRLPDPRTLWATTPPALAELCLTATEPEREHRAVTARQMAEQVTRHLDRARRARELGARALALLTTARETAERARAAEERISSATARQAAERARNRADAPPEVWERLWDEDEMLRAAAAEVALRQADAARLAEQSLVLEATPEGHALLHALFEEMAGARDDAGDPAGAALFRARAAPHAAALGLDASARPATLAPTGLPASARCLGAPLRRHGPRLRPDGELRPIAFPADLAPGPWYFELAAPGHHPLSCVRVMRSGEVASPDWRLPAASTDATLVRFVPGGAYFLQTDPAAPDALPTRTVTIPPLLVQTLPVSLGEYAAFLDEVGAQHAPRSNDGLVYFTPDPESGRFVLPFVDRDGETWRPDWPAHMICWHDAMAYCEWRSRRDGLPWRLPTEHEWEVAARGEDQRRYPWGDGFDVCLARMARTRPNHPGPATLDAHPLDVSPFGLRHMGGLVIEWTSTVAEIDGERRVLRGGGFGSSELHCRAAARTTHFAHWKGVQFGLRLVREVDLTDPENPAR